MKLLKTILSLLLLVSCAQEELIDVEGTYPSFYSEFSQKIDLNNLPNYENQAIPNYIREDNTGRNFITNKGALLGRVLFYDTELSSNRTISCSSCHQQENAFSDISDVSTGVNGVTGRHSMRLVNTRFADEVRFFWDERASTLEEQTTQPIRDHAEMGFSGNNGDPNFNDLLERLSAIGYYQDLFRYVFGDDNITESRIQDSLAQFIRSIQSFDSRYDQGRQAVVDDNMNFPNFTADENAGKTLFIRRRNEGGADCAGCHRPPEFGIRSNSRNNGVIAVFGSSATDTTITRSPSLRDLVKPNGGSNGAFMHDASLATLTDVVNHYSTGISSNPNLDNRLDGPNLNLSTAQINQLVAFMRTLSGTNIYTDEKWSDPF